MRAIILSRIIQRNVTAFPSGHGGVFPKREIKKIYGEQDGTLRARYLGSVFHLLRVAAGWSVEEMVQKLGLRRAPTVGGLRIPTNDQLNDKRALDLLVSHAPRVFQKPGVGDVLRAFCKGENYEKHFSPELLAIVSANEHHLVIKGKLAAAFDLKEPEPAAKPAQSVDPLDLPAVDVWRPTQAVAQERLLSRKKTQGEWLDLSDDEKLKRIKVAERNLCVAITDGKTTLEDQWAQQASKLLGSKQILPLNTAINTLIRISGYPHKPARSNRQLRQQLLSSLTPGAE